MLRRVNMPLMDKSYHGTVLVSTPAHVRGYRSTLFVRMPVPCA